MGGKNNEMALHSSWVLKLLALCLLGVAVGFVFVPPPANAQDVNLLPALDLSLGGSPYDPADSASLVWTVTVRNHQLPGRPPLAADNVVVRITATMNGQEYRATVNPANAISAGAFDASSGLWTIPSIPPGGSAQATLSPGRFGPNTQQPTPLRLHAELVAPGLSGESPPSPANNEIEAWYVRTASDAHWPRNDAGVQASVDNRRPELGTLTTFEVAAANYNFLIDAPEIPGTINFSGWEVQVKIELSPGLSHSSVPVAPSGTSFDPNTGIWDVGHIADADSAIVLPVPVTVTTDTLDNIPLERRCLTATLVSAVPAYDLYAGEQENDITMV